eukprot:7097842-Pyramimonas_sp.AAC.1
MMGFVGLSRSLAPRQPQLSRRVGGGSERLYAPRRGGSQCTPFRATIPLPLAPIHFALLDCSVAVAAVSALGKQTRSEPAAAAARARRPAGRPPSGLPYC